MGRKKENRTKVLYVRVMPENYNFAAKEAKAKGTRVSIWIDLLLSRMRTRTKANVSNEKPV